MENYIELFEFSMSTTLDFQTKFTIHVGDPNILSINPHCIRKGHLPSLWFCSWNVVQSILNLNLSFFRNAENVSMLIVLIHYQPTDSTRARQLVLPPPNTHRLLTNPLIDFRTTGSRSDPLLKSAIRYRWHKREILIRSRLVAFVVWSLLHGVGHKTTRSGQG